MRIALAQINPIVGDLKGNQNKITEFVDKARSRKADMVVFPELSLCGYPPEDLLLKGHFVKENKKALLEIIKHSKNVGVIVGFVDEDKKGNLFNAAAVIENGKLKGVYRKQALPNYGVFDEKRYFTQGQGDHIFTIGKTKVGVNICEDIWVDGGAYKSQAKKGVKILINISSSPYDVDKLETRIKLLQKRAKETKAFICYVNLIGGQDELVFDGSSLVVNPKGNVIAFAEEFEEDMVIVDLSEENKEIKKVSSNIERIYKALVLGTRDYIRKNGFKKVLIGLSGGIDSAIVAAVAVEAIGKENVIGVSMPSRFSSQGTRSDAQALARNLRIDFKEIPIEDPFKVYLSTLEKEFTGQAPNIAEENIQARIRGNILMALSNKFGWLVLTTGNKSEFAVGYCTLYGDMSGGFAVIKDVPKTKVYELAGFINKQRPGSIPQSIIDRAPTAELKENQKDQDSLPPYEVLDKILEDYVEHHRPFAQLIKKYDSEIVKKVIKLVDLSEYKRRQSPPGPKVTSRAFGKDWRLPITNKYKEF